MSTTRKNVTERTNQRNQIVPKLLLWLIGFVTLLIIRSNYVSDNTYPSESTLGTLLQSYTAAQPPWTGSFANCSGHSEATPLIFGFHDGSVTIACQTIHYKAPIVHLKEKSNDQVTLMVGILSGSDCDRRNGIRETWATMSQQPHKVLFVVAGKFETFESEYMEHQDMLWLDKEDTYDNLTYKTFAFLQVVHDHVSSFTHVLKTDDDVFVNLTKIQESMLFNDTVCEAPYWGHCQTRYIAPFRTGHKPQPDDGYDPKFVLTLQDYPETYFPPYCVGAGFRLSRDFVHCAVMQMKNMRYLKFEDAATGMLAQRCNYSPLHSPKTIFAAKGRPGTPHNLFIQHGLHTRRRMLFRWNGTKLPIPPYLMPVKKEAQWNYLNDKEGVQTLAK